MHLKQNMKYFCILFQCRDGFMNLFFPLLGKKFYLTMLFLYKISRYIGKRILEYITLLAAVFVPNFIFIISDVSRS